MQSHLFPVMEAKDIHTSSRHLKAQNINEQYTMNILRNSKRNIERSLNMIYSHEVENMCPIAQGVNHGAAPIPEEAKWVKAKDVTDISGLTHGIGW